MQSNAFFRRSTVYNPFSWCIIYLTKHTHKNETYFKYHHSCNHKCCIILRLYGIYILEQGLLCDY